MASTGFTFNSSSSLSSLFSSTNSTTSSSSLSSLFSSTTSSPPFQFPPSSSASLFSFPAASTRISFGVSSAPASPPRIFGSPSSQTPSLFRPASTPASSPLVSGAASSTSTSSPFGAAVSTPPAPSPLFGATVSTPPAPSPLFGATASTPPASSPLFGATSSTTPASSSLFGANAASTTPASSPLFGSSTASSSPSVGFASAFSLNAPSSSSTTSTTTSTTASTSLFGATPAASLFGSPTPSSNLFGSTPVMNSFSMVEATGIYQFKINHSETKDMGNSEWITSQKFKVGKHNWAIKYFPQGNRGNNGQHVSVFLELLRKSVDVRATFEFSLLNKDGTLSSIHEEVSHTFTSREVDWGFSKFLERTKLEEIYVKDSYFVINVKITIKDESCTGAHWKNNSTGFLHEHLQMFREENKHTDVSFDVDGKIFVAHRLILAAHSPVFEAELFGSMVESNMNCVKINEMMPSVFKAMLDFMYNDSLSGIEKLDDHEDLISSTVFLQHLLAAADRYAVQKLKATCEYALVKSIALETVLSTLELAEKHNCSELKKDCLRFVVDKDNFVSLALTDEYIKLMQNYPSLMVELKDLVGK